MSEIRKGVANVNQKHYGVIAVVALMYCSVAAGAFGIEEMISTCGPGMTIIALVGMVFVWAIPDCFCVAEVGSVLPAEGGDIFWAKHTLGEFYSFQEGVWYAISYYAASGTYIVLATNYMGYFFEWNNAQAFIVKLIIVIAFTVLNLAGLKEVSIASIICSVFILLVFAFITVVGFGNWNYDPMEPIFNEDEGVSSSIGQALSIGVWMYCGWAMINQLSGEVKNQMVIPKSILIVCPLIGLSYVLPTLAGVASVGHWDSWTTDLVAARYGHRDRILGASEDWSFYRCRQDWKESPIGVEAVGKKAGPLLHTHTLGIHYILCLDSHYNCHQPHSVTLCSKGDIVARFIYVACLKTINAGIAA